MSTVESSPPRAAVTSPHSAWGYRYPGSPPFGDSDLDRIVFRGRTVEAREVLHSILSFDLFVIFGESGVGKSSLLNAGVFEALRARDLWPFVVRLNDPDVRPIDLVTTSLIAAAQADDTVDVTTHPAADGSPPDTLWDLFSALEVWRGNALQRPVMVLDQFEELFTLDFADPARHDFVVQLGELVRRHRASDHRTIDVDAPDLPDPDAKVVLVLREDWLGELDAMSVHVPQIMRHRFRVQGLEPEQARSAIVDPAVTDDPRLRSHRFTYSPDAADLLLQFLRTREVRGQTHLAPRVDPSQLQIVCQHIERFILPRKAGEAGESVEITAEDLGGPQGLNDILRDFYQREIAALAPDDQPKARALCEAGLISRSGRRLSLEQGEIEADWGVPRPLLEELIDRRLLRAEPRVGSVYYELAHDTLVPAILEQGREWLTLREREEHVRRRAARLDRWSLGLAVVNLPFGYLSGPLVAVAVLALRSPPTQRAGRWRARFALGVGLFWYALYALWGLWTVLTPESSNGLYAGDPWADRWRHFALISLQSAIGAAVGIAWPIGDERSRGRWTWVVGSAVVVLLVMATVSVLLAAPPTQDVLKPNSREHELVASPAPPIVVGDGAVTGGTVELEVPASAGVHQDLRVVDQNRIVIDVHGQAGIDPVLVVLDGELVLGTDDDGGGGLDSRLELELPPGDYTIEVFAFHGETGRIVIDVTAPADAATADDGGVSDASDPNEPNDTAIDATPITTSASGAIVPADDDDYFVLDHVGGGLTISPSGCEDDAADTFVTLWEADGATPFGTSADASGDGTCSPIVVGDLPAGTYYITVESLDPSVTVASYTLTVTSE